MATIEVKTTQEEQHIVLEALKKLQGKAAAVSAVAKEAGMNPNRVRYILVDLEDTNKIKRIPTKAFNKHYVRYSYEVLV